MTIVTSGYSFHEDFASTIQNHIENLNKIEQQVEPPHKRLKSTDTATHSQTSIIQNIQRDLFDNICNITSCDENALMTLHNRVGQPSPAPGSDEEKLCKQIADILESINKQINLNNLPLDIIKNIAFELPYSDLRNFSIAYKFIRNKNLLDIEKHTHFFQRYLHSFGLFLRKYGENEIQLVGNEVRLKNCINLVIDISQKIKSLNEIDLSQCTASLKNIFDLMRLPSLKNLTLALELDHPISEDDLTAVVDKLPSSVLENFSFSIYNDPYATIEGKKLDNNFLMDHFIKHVINSKKFSSLKSFGIASDILRYNGLDYLKLTDERIQDLINSLEFETIYLNIANWDSLVTCLADHPKAEKIRKLMLNTEGHSASEAMSKFAQSQYLTNVRELIMSASYDIPEDVDGQELEFDEFDGEAIQELSKSPNLKNVEILDIGQHSSLEHIEPWTEQLNSLNLSALLESDHWENLKHLSINIETFLPEDLLKVFNREKFPNLESLYIRVLNEDNNPPIVEKITSVDELKEFYKKWEKNLDPARKNLLGIIREFNQ